MMIDIMPNENWNGSICARFEEKGEPGKVKAVKYEGNIYEVVGWTPDGPCQAYGVLVEDSGAGSAILVYGGECGIRLRKSGSLQEWDVNNSGQTGEPYLKLSPDCVELFSF